MLLCGASAARGVSVGFLMGKRKGFKSSLKVTTPATWGKRRCVSVLSRRSATALGEGAGVTPWQLEFEH